MHLLTRLSAIVKLRIAIAVLATWSLSARDMLAQSIPDEPTCPRCRIEIRITATLGADDGPGSIQGQPADVFMDAKSRYWLLIDDAVPMLFDSRGGFVQAVGRLGRGPGEMLLPHRGMLAANDSVVLFDMGSFLAHVLGPDLTIKRSIRFRAASFWASAAVKWPSHVMIAASVPTATSVGFPLHVIDLSTTEATNLSAFGEDNTGSLLPHEDGKLAHTNIVVRNDKAWAADRLLYRVSQWDFGTGRLLNSLVRNPSWFNGWSTGLRGGPRRPPQPVVSTIMEDAAGLIWVFVLSPRADFAEAWKNVKMPSGRGDVPASIFPKVHELYETTIEILDPVTRSVVATAKYPHPIIAALPQIAGAAAYHVNEAGIPTVSILGVALRRN